MFTFLATRALALDFDGDGYPIPPMFDCDDNAPGINPAAQESVGDEVDQDCDGSDALRRYLIVPSFGIGWTLAGGASANADTVTLPNGGASATRGWSLGGSRGALWVVADIDAHSGFACHIDLTVNDGSGTPHTESQAVTATGTVVFHFSTLPNPPRTLTQVALTCPALGAMTVDWFSIQNSDDILWPPAKDIQATWEDMNTPGVGGSVGVTRSTNDAYLLTANDASGIGVRGMDIDTPWQAANGSGDGGLPMPHAWDVAGVEWDETGPLEIFAVVGELTGQNTVGGLWYSDDLGATWVEVVDTWHDQVGAVSEENDCSGDKDIRAGSLLVADEDAEDLWVASNAHSVAPLR